MHHKMVQWRVNDCFDCKSIIVRVFHEIAYVVTSVTSVELVYLIGWIEVHDVFYVFCDISQCLSHISYRFMFKLIPWYQFINDFSNVLYLVIIVC